MVRFILRRVVINRNNLREVSLCKWLICLPEMYPVIICISAVAENSRMSLAGLGGTLPWMYHSFYNHDNQDHLWWRIGTANQALVCARYCGGHFPGTRA